MSGVIWYETDSIYELITADWEAYPIGNTEESALENLSWFDPKTKFYKIDDICEAILFVTTNPSWIEKNNKNKKNPKDKNTPFDSEYLHISLWHKNLLELNELGYIEGVKPMTDYEYNLVRWNNIVQAMNIKIDDEGYFNYPNGDRIMGMPQPSKDWYDDTDHVWANMPNGYITLTQRGIDKINEPINDYKINEEIYNRVKPLLDIKYYDSAVRESSIMLEVKLKNLNNTNLFGKNLVDFHYKRLTTKLKGSTAYYKYYRSLLMCSVNFIRNEYAHNFPITSENRAKRLITLYAKLYELTDELEDYNG